MSLGISANVNLWRPYTYTHMWICIYAYMHEYHTSVISKYIGKRQEGWAVHDLMLQKNLSWCWVGALGKPSAVSLFPSSPSRDSSQILRLREEVTPGRGGGRVTALASLTPGAGWLLSPHRHLYPKNALYTEFIQKTNEYLKHLGIKQLSKCFNSPTETNKHGILKIYKCPLI